MKTKVKKKLIIVVVVLPIIFCFLYIIYPLHSYYIPITTLFFVPFWIEIYQDLEEKDEKERLNLEKHFQNTWFHPHTVTSEWMKVKPRTIFSYSQLNRGFDPKYSYFARVSLSYDEDNLQPSKTSVTIVQARKKSEIPDHPQNSISVTKAIFLTYFDIVE